MITVFVENKGMMQAMSLENYVKSLKQPELQEKQTKRYIVTRSGERIELSDENLDFHQCDDEPK